MKLIELDIFKQHCLLKGCWTTADTSMSVTNPASSKIIAQIPDLPADTVNQAIANVQVAMFTWQASSPAQDELAVAERITAKFRNAGQTCLSANRVYVQEDTMPAFSKRLVEQVSQLCLGDGIKPDTLIGPLFDAAAVAKMLARVADALSTGATLLCGRLRLTAQRNWYKPTVLSDAPPPAQCACEETFGPLVPLIPFRDEHQVIGYANDTQFGLAAYLFSDNLHRVQRVVEKHESGMVRINTSVISATNTPFGGVKASGLGREGAHAGHRRIPGNEVPVLRH